MALRKSSFLLGSALGAVLGLASPAGAQSAASADTGAVRYDKERRVAGTIAPDPDGAGPLKFAATRNVYDDAGNLVKVEKGELSAWQSEAVAPKDWTGFTILQTIDMAYDLMGRKLRESLSGIEPATGQLALQSVTQTSYDNFGRVQCTAVRMNPDLFSSLPVSACDQATPAGAHGPDRIVRNVYSEAGFLAQVREGVGTADEAAEATFGYTANGQREQVIDANGNRAKFAYDGHDRLSRWTFPSASPPPASFDASTPATAFDTAGAINAADYEEYEYDKAGNRISLRKRDGQYILASYDALNRLSVKDVPGTADVAYRYDLRGLQLSASFTATGESVSAEFDNAGRLVSSSSSMGGTARTLASQTDRNGNRESLTFGDGTVLSYDHDGLNRMTAIRANGGAAAVSFAYDRLGRRETLTRANGTSTSYAYDGASRLKVLTNSFPADPGKTQQVTFAYNRASQIVTRSASNDAYAFTALAAGTTPYARNGLNQYTSIDGAAVTHDANGNLKSEGGTTFTYDVENRLISASGATNASLAYDPLGRLWQITAAGATTRFLYDGDRLVEERDGAGNVLRKYAHGPGVDEPLVQYEGTSIDAPRWLHADERGSIVATSNGAGAVTAINRYDEYGQPQSSAGTGTLATRFGYTGQAWLPEVKVYYYKARMYRPRDGRFMQVDPVGYDGGINMYEYGASDPINNTDPEGRFPAALLACAGPQVVACAAVGGVAVLIAVAASRRPDTSVPASDRIVTQGDNGGPPLDGGPPRGPNVKVVLPSTPTDRISAHQLDRKTLEAAQRELRGESVGRRPDGRSWDHVAKVRNGQQGLVNRIEHIKRTLGYPKLAAEDRLKLVQELRKASKKLDETERYVPR